VSYKIETRVDKDLSIDLSYIVHYRVTKDGALIGDGIVDYNRQAAYNDIPVSENIPPSAIKQVRKQIAAETQDYINQHGQ